MDVKTDTPCVGLKDQRGLMLYEGDRVMVWPGWQKAEIVYVPQIRQYAARSIWRESQCARLLSTFDRRGRIRRHNWLKGVIKISGQREGAVRV